MMEGDSDLALQFMQLTGCTRDAASIWLEMGMFEMDKALSMYYEGDKPAVTGGTGGAVDLTSNDMNNDIDYNDSNNYNAMQEEDTLRAADPSVTTNLLGGGRSDNRDMMDMMGMPAPLAMQRAYALQQQTLGVRDGKITLDSSTTNSVFGFQQNSGSGPNGQLTKKEQTLAEMYKANQKLLFRLDNSCFNSGIL